ncbi:unnamed protein product [Gongylonema pulchrum]|uniref:Uncharacterized protein n=1 Tax=Gongylonema pulchrum TaxID=637853 RepID=A0A3P7NEI2_9BILA|nr:unnamed protein product [Gongylonema pulchrum]
MCVKEMGGCFVPVGEAGIELITKEEYERDAKTDMGIRMESLKT